VKSDAGAQEVRGVRVESFEGRGEGRADVKLGRMAASRLDVEVESRLELAAGVGGPQRAQMMRARTLVREW
jgi:hypothetical protein